MGKKSGLMGKSVPITADMLNLNKSKINLNNIAGAAAASVLSGRE